MRKVLIEIPFAWPFLRRNWNFNIHFFFIYFWSFHHNWRSSNTVEMLKHFLGCCHSWYPCRCPNSYEDRIKPNLPSSNLYLFYDLLLEVLWPEAAPSSPPAMKSLPDTAGLLLCQQWWRRTWRTTKDRTISEYQESEEDIDQSCSAY